MGVSESTARNWLQKGKIQGERGDQPTRPRWIVVADEDGCPVDRTGKPVVGHAATHLSLADVDDLVQRVAQLERRQRDGQLTETENFRDAALQLSAAMDHQRRAFELQVEATAELNRAVADQAAIISGLLTGDPTVLVERTR
jgi:hypothetical protein